LFFYFYPVACYYFCGEREWETFLWLKAMSAFKAFLSLPGNPLQMRGSDQTKMAQRVRGDREKSV